MCVCVCVRVFVHISNHMNDNVYISMFVSLICVSLSIIRLLLFNISIQPYSNLFAKYSELIRKIWEYKSKKLLTSDEGDPKALFSIATASRCRGWHHPLPGLFHFTLDVYLIMLTVKQGGIKYHFFRLWYDST